MVVETATGPAAVDGGALVANAIDFGRLLRRAGIGADAGSTRDFLRALALIGFDRRDEVKAAGRAVFVRRHDEIAIYDAAFDLFWRRRASGLPGPGLPMAVIRRRPDRRGAGLDAGNEPEVTGDKTLLSVAVATASAAELLRTVDFARLSPAEEREAAAMIEALRPALPVRRTRRGEPAPRGVRPASRAMLRRALATGGAPVEWLWVRRRVQPRPIVFICDISGSMERYSRFLLRFAHALGRAGARTESFVFGTRMTRITRQLRHRDVDAALARVAASVVDWSGGTRIGQALRELNVRWARRTIRSGAVVIVVSDGWERGDPAVLAEEMARLQRSCWRLIWLDPLAGTPGFAPLTAGLRAALPYVDDFLPCHDVASLERFAALLADLPPRRRGGGRDWLAPAVA
ncbi:MAG: hypothetical protein A2X23_04605 [Chloroflexi bacterium GWC2_73_18]|nr:MAG: hypothetical protein A2X23_04605 [Chloroflexi bacterium GWC2_73_18]